MLIGIDPLLNADILHCLVSMGHVDSIVLCDANFPAASIANKTVCSTPLQMNVNLLTSLKAILGVFPVDTYDLENPPVKAMQIVGAPTEIPSVISEVS